MKPIQHPTINANKSSPKKTRDLPNLTECHACGLRIDTCTTGKNKLQPLYSEWRIVLLCENCYSCVESSQFCSYCFKESFDDYFCCCQCKRLVHTSCFSKYATVAPWSYSCSGSGDFSVCVDCWVPKSIARRREVFRRSKRKSSRVLGVTVGCGEKKKKKSFEDVVKDANCVAQKKVEAAARARELAVRKAWAARRAAELARNALNLVANADDNALESNADDEFGVDETEFGFQLHPAMNSLSRISKNLCFVNSSSLDVPRIGECNGELLVRGSDLRNPGACVRALSHNTSMDMECLQSDGIDDVGISPNAKDGNVDVHLEGEGSCSIKLINSSGDDSSMNSESQSCRAGDESMAAENERSDGKHDRYMMKYSRRKLVERSVPDSRPKILYEGLHHEAQALASGLLLSCSKESITCCSKESITFSNTSLQSLSFSLQASACSSGLSQD